MLSTAALRTSAFPIAVERVRRAANRRGERPPKLSSWSIWRTRHRTNRPRQRDSERRAFAGSALDFDRAAEGGYHGAYGTEPDTPATRLRYLLARRYRVGKERFFQVGAIARGQAGGRCLLGKFVPVDSPTVVANTEHEPSLSLRESLEADPVLGDLAAGLAFLLCLQTVIYRVPDHVSKYSPEPRERAGRHAQPGRLHRYVGFALPQPACQGLDLLSQAFEAIDHRLVAPAQHARHEPFQVRGTFEGEQQLLVLLDADRDPSAASSR